GWFELTRNGQAFVGRWRPGGEGRWGDWLGERVGFDGVWESDYGKMRLVRDGDRVHGAYEGAPGATIDGRLANDQLEFAYHEPKVQGEGWFRLSEDGLRFQGEWRPEGAANWGVWRGRRSLPRPGIFWLAVVEAPWQRYLTESEYSFGHMLREFFARSEHVRVRHRFF